MHPSTTKEAPTFETASDVAGRTPREYGVAETRKSTAETLVMKSERISIPLDASPQIAILVENFNAIQSAKPSELNKSDGWDFVASLLTFLTWEWKKTDANTSLVNELNQKTLAFFGSPSFLEASGMNAESRFLDGFISSLSALESKAKRALTQNTIDPAKNKNQWTEPLPQL